MTNHANFNVLIVDDEILIQNLIKSVLATMGIQKVKTAMNGQMALTAIQSGERTGAPFNVVICDWDMPVMDGLSFLGAFRKTNRTAIVIMITAHSSSSDFAEAKQKGADYFFMKPIEPVMLKIRLGGALDALASRI